MIETRGAPYVQGWNQGEALEHRIRADLSRARAELGRWTWWRAARRFRRGSGRVAARFLPQHHERLAGIAAGAGVPVGSLGLLDLSCRLGVAAGLGAQGLEAWIPVPRILQSRLLLRRSVPDVGGFASVELTWAPSAGCLAGVNAEGLGVICERDADSGTASARLLAQELLLRVPQCDSAVEHARRRGTYVGGDWSLVVADRSGSAARVECGRGGIRVSEEVGEKPEGEGLRVELHPAERRLRLWGRPGLDGYEGTLDVAVEQV